MPNTNKQQFQEYRHSQLHESYYESLAALLYELNIDGQEYVDLFTKTYISHTFEKTRKKSETLIATGFGRRLFEKHIELKKKIKQNNKSNRYTLITRLMRISEKNDKLITIKKFNSLFYDIYGHNGETTSKCMLDTLIRTKILSKHNCLTVKFDSIIPTINNNSIDDIKRLFSDLTRRLSSTYINNLNAKHNEETLLQMTISTTEIPTHLHKMCTDELRIKMRAHQKELLQILETYEAKTEFDKALEASKNKEVGFSQLIFNNEIK